MKIVLLDGCEKEYEQTQNMIHHLTTGSQQHQIFLQTIVLREKRISHCTKCLVCTNKQGVDPVKCFLEDGMDDVIDIIEQADAYIIMTDRKSVLKRNKLFRKFSSRLLAYYYRPSKNEPPRRRRPKATKNAIIINYNLSNFFPNLSFNMAKYYINKSSKDIGAQVIDSLMIQPAQITSTSWQESIQKVDDSFQNLININSLS